MKKGRETVGFRFANWREELHAFNIVPGHLVSNKSSEKAVAVGLSLISFKDAERQQSLCHYIDLVARLYWEDQEYSKSGPSAAVRQANVKKIKPAATSLLEIVRTPMPSGLRWLVNNKTGHLLTGDDASIERILEGLIAACDGYGSPARQKSGPKRPPPLATLVWSLAGIWEEFNEARFPMSLGTVLGSAPKIDGRKGAQRLEFTSPGPRFVQAVAMEVDPRIVPSTIARILRLLPK